MKKTAALLCLVLTGCTSVTDVTKTGRDTYMVGVTVRMGVSGDAGATSEAIQAANKFCSTKGQIAQVSGTQSSGTQGLTPVGSVVHFSCVNA